MLHSGFASQLVQGVQAPPLYSISHVSGKLTTDELLTAIVLDGAVNEGERVVDEEVYKVFDKDTVRTLPCI